MELNLTPEEDALSPVDVRFLDVHVEPWPDGRRVRIHVETTPFQQRPNFQAVVVNPAGDEVCSINIIEAMDNRFVFTLHLRGEPSDKYSLDISIFYDDLGNVDQRQLSFDVPPPAE